MAKAKNSVVAGDYAGKSVLNMANGLIIAASFSVRIPLNKTAVAAYELVTDEHRKSAKSGVARGAVGGLLFGPVGLLAGGLSAKSKGIYQVAIEFRDGKRSLLELNDKLYKDLIKNCF